MKTVTRTIGGQTRRLHNSSTGWFLSHLTCWWLVDSDILIPLWRTECFKKQYSEYYLPEIGDYVGGLMKLISSNSFWLEKTTWSFYKQLKCKHVNFRSTENLLWERTLLIMVVWEKHIMLIIITLGRLERNLNCQVIIALLTDI